MKMNVGLSENKNIEQQKGLCSIEAIYRKYDSNCPYSPLGHGATDIIDNKTGWFFDGFPIHSTGYANSPQWFNYLCGKSYVYFESIPEEKRNGYQTNHGYAERNPKKNRGAEPKDNHCPGYSLQADRMQPDPYERSRQLGS